MTLAKRIFAAGRDSFEVTPSGSNTQHTESRAPVAALKLEVVGGASPDSVAYLLRRYSEEMRAGEMAQTKKAKIAHYELAYCYALRVRDSRANMQF